jgi:hypothetical protein
VTRDTNIHIKRNYHRIAHNADKHMLGHCLIFSSFETISVFPFESRTGHRVS